MVNGIDNIDPSMYRAVVDYREVNATVFNPTFNNFLIGTVSMAVSKTSIT